MNKKGLLDRVGEAAVIVVSILLAFAIDAYWGEREDRSVETAAYASLEREFIENRNRLVAKREDHLARHRAAAGMLATIVARGDPPGSYKIPEEVFTIGGYDTFEPARGAVTSILNSGNLLLIRNDSLRMALSAWPDALDDLALQESVVLDVNENHIVPILHRHIPYVTFDYESGAPGFSSPSRFSPDTEGLLESLEFENWIDLQILRMNDLLETYDELIAEVDRILALLRAPPG
jgi:hypothetical protein